MPDKRAVPTEERNKQLSELVRGANVILENAQQLFGEACLLKDNGALSRALFLHQISMEECAKIEMLGGWATSLLMGHNVNIMELSKEFASHKSKNYTNAYMLPLSDEETQARRHGDTKDSLKAFKDLQASFHQESNAAKNASLYVDYQEGKFATPGERITEEMVLRISAANSDFLQAMRLKTEILSGWQDNEDSIAATMANFKTRLEELKTESPHDPLNAFSILMDEMMKEIAASRNDGQREGPSRERGSD